MNLIKQGEIGVVLTLAWHAFIGRCQASFNIKGPTVEDFNLLFLCHFGCLTISAGLFVKRASTMAVGRKLSIRKIMRLADKRDGGLRAQVLP